MTKEQLNKFLNNECSKQELGELIQWINSEAFEEERRSLILEDWNCYAGDDIWDDNEKYTALFDKIQECINKRECEQQTDSAPKYVLYTLKDWIIRAAAVVLIPVLAFLLYTLSENKILTTQIAKVQTDTVEVIAPIGSRTVVQLSDGTEVNLNYGSRIKYPRTFGGDNREVTLVGEGFFDVTHNPDKPFTVKTGKLNVKVLGTSFNVNAYPDKDVIETTLVTGKVMLEQVRTGSQIKKIGIMKPSQHVKYNAKTGALNTSKCNVEKYIAWKDDRLVFDDTPILEVAERLNRMFNVDIRVNKEIEDLDYSVTLINESLNQILDLMSIASPIQYKIQPRERFLDGTYKKQIIIIEKRKSN